MKEGAVKTVSKRWDGEADVLIIGSGFAGLAGAIEAHDAGASVMVLEKMPVRGGNSIIAGGLYNCVDPERQKAQGIKDSTDCHYEQTLAGGDYRADPEKVRYLAEHALEGWQWLERMGVKLAGPIIQIYGAMWPRSHPPSYKGKIRGGAIISALYDQVKSRGIPLLLKHKVSRIIRQEPLEGRIVGVEVETDAGKLNFKAERALILAAGGFCANVKMRTKHDPRFDDRFTTDNRACATGEVINMAADIGASIIGLDYIQSIGAVGRDLRYMPRPAPVRHMSPAMDVNGLSTNSTVYINFQGERIVACDARREHITEAIMRTPEKMCYMISDFQGLDATGRTLGPQSIERVKKIVEKYPNEAFIADTVSDLAIKIGMDPNTLEKTIDQFNSYVDAKHDPDFHQAPRNLAYKIEIAPFFAVSGSPALHYMCGGLEFETTTCRVVDRWGKIIPGLCASGEITGGVHGTNRLGGNATTDCIVFGRVAGKTAAAEKPWHF